MACSGFLRDFDPEQISLRLVVEKLAKGQVFLPVRRPFPVNIILLALHTHLHLHVALS